jgi:hypothetical protein
MAQARLWQLGDFDQRKPNESSIKASSIALQP